MANTAMVSAPKAQEEKVVSTRMSAKNVGGLLAKEYNKSENAKGNVSKTFAKEVIGSFMEDCKGIKLTSVIDRAFKVADKADKRYTRSTQRAEAKFVYEELAWEFNKRDLAGKENAFCAPCKADVSALNPENGNTMYWWFEDGMVYVIFRQKPTFSIHKHLVNDCGLQKDCFCYSGIATQEEIVKVLPLNFQAKVCPIKVG